MPPVGSSECFVLKSKQTSIRGQAAHPGYYELRRLRVEHLRGVTHVDPPGIGFEVRDYPEVVGWHLR